MILNFKYALIGAIAFGLIGLSGCQSIKPYQRMYLNDSDMQMGRKEGAGFEQSVEVIREGASGGGGKATGGCGCN